MMIQRILAQQVKENLYHVVVLPKEGCPKHFVVEASSKKEATAKAEELFYKKVKS